MSQKERIIEVSLQQFLAHGIKKMTVQKLVESLGLSTKTVYKYFVDKEDLLKQCLFVHYSNLFKETLVLEKEISNPVVNLLAFWHEVFKLDFGVNNVFYSDLNHYYPKLQDLILEKFSSQGQVMLTNIVIEGIEKGFFRSNIQLGVVLEIMGVLYGNITRNTNFKALNYSPIIIMQNTLDIYIRGICTEKGLVAFNDCQKGD